MVKYEMPFAAPLFRRIPRKSGQFVGRAVTGLKNRHSVWLKGSLYLFGKDFLDEFQCLLRVLIHVNSEYFLDVWNIQLYH